PPLRPPLRARAAVPARASATTPATPTTPLSPLSPLSPFRPLAQVGAVIAASPPRAGPSGPPATAPASPAAACTALGGSAVAAQLLRHRGRRSGRLGRHQLDPRLEVRVHFNDPDLWHVGGRHAWPTRTPTEPGAARRNTG